MGLIVRTAKGTLFGCLWKLKYGRKIRVGFPQGLEKTRVEKDREAEIRLGERIQNRGGLYIGCKGQGKLEIGAHCFFNIKFIADICIFTFSYQNIINKYITKRI